MPYDITGGIEPILEQVDGWGELQHGLLYQLVWNATSL
jgi:hypothetical protein